MLRQIRVGLVPALSGSSQSNSMKDSVCKGVRREEAGELGARPVSSEGTSHT